MSGEGEAAEERRGGQPGGWDLEDQENTSGVTLSETGAIAGAGARVRHDGIEAEPRGGCSEQRWRSWSEGEGDGQEVKVGVPMCRADCGVESVLPDLAGFCPEACTRQVLLNSQEGSHLLPILQKGTEAQRGEVTCPGSSSMEARVGSAPRPG